MSSHQVEVAVSALRQEAKVWSAQAGHMKALAGKSSGMTISGIQGGIFHAMLSSYNTVALRLSSLSGNAGTAFTEIGSTLMAAAHTYEAEDLNMAHQYRKLY